MKGAPRMAPTPIASDASASPPVMIGPRMAITGIRVSGMAVATAASTLPTAPSARFSLCPNHSIPLVNSSAASRMMPSDASRRTTSKPYPPRERATTVIRSPGTIVPGLGAQVLRGIRQQRHMPCALERGAQHPLVAGAGAGLAARLDLRALAEVSAGGGVPPFVGGPRPFVRKNLEPSAGP